MHMNHTHYKTLKFDRNIVTVTT